MGMGPEVTCSKCGRHFFGGKGYDKGVKNYCYECLLPMADTIDRSEYGLLGQTQQGLIDMVHQMGGLKESGGAEYWITMMKVNAGELSKDALENITDLSADARGVDRDFERLSVNGEEAMLDKDYSKAVQLFRQLVTRFPDEGAPIIRLCSALRRADKLSGDEHIKMLNKAEHLITSKTSKYPMDMFEGLRDLYFLRACCYVLKAAVDRNNYSEAEEELKKAFKLDPEYKDARELERYIRECKSKAVSSDSRSQGTETVSKYCPKCNASYNLAKKFCGKCGVPLVAGTLAPVAQSSSPEVSPEATPDITRPEAPLSVPKSGQSRLLVGALGAVVIIVAGYFGYDYIKPKRPADTSSNLSQNIGQKETPRKPTAPSTSQVPSPSAKPAEPADVPVNKVDTDSGKSEQKLGPLAQYRNMYEPSEIDYSQKYPPEFNMLYKFVKEALDRRELEDTINRKASQLDETYLGKIRFFAAPDSLKQQKQQHTDYVPILVNDTTLKEGLAFFAEYKDTIMRAYLKYNVKPEDIISVINWESRFGKHRGEYSVYKVFVGNLFHISEMENQIYVEGGYNKEDVVPRDKALTRIEKLKQRAALNLASLLKLSMKKNFNPYEIKGSWAGAIGIPQFMPASMVYAADGDGNGEIDLNNMHDAIFSVSNFLYQHSYCTKGAKYSLAKYNPEEMYVRGVCLYSSRIMEKGLSY